MRVLGLSLAPLAWPLADRRPGRPLARAPLAAWRVGPGPRGPWRRVLGPGGPWLKGALGPEAWLGKPWWGPLARGPLGRGGPGPWPGLPLVRGALGPGGPLRGPLAGALNPETRWPKSPWPRGPLVLGGPWGALGRPGGPWPGALPQKNPFA